MATVSELGRGVHVGIRQFSEETGLDRDTVRKRIDAAGLKPGGERGGHPVYRLRDLLKAAYQVSEDGRQDPSQLRPFERQAHWKAEHLQLQVEAEKRELIPRIEVEQEQARILRVVALFLDTLPDILERDCGLAAAMIVAVEKRLDQMREELHKELSEDEDEAAA